MSSGIFIDMSNPLLYIAGFKGVDFSGDCNPTYYPPDADTIGEAHRSDAIYQGLGYFDPSLIEDESTAYEYGSTPYSSEWQYFLLQSGSTGPAGADRYGSKRFGLVIENGVIRSYSSASSGTDGRFNKSYTTSEINTKGSSANTKNFTQPKVDFDPLTGDWSIVDGEKGVLRMWFVMGVSRYAECVVVSANNSASLPEWGGMSNFTCCAAIEFHLNAGLISQLKVGGTSYGGKVYPTITQTLTEDKLELGISGFSTDLITIPLVYGLSHEQRRYHANSWVPDLGRPVVWYRNLHIKVTNGLIEQFYFSNAGNKDVVKEYNEGALNAPAFFQFSGDRNESFGLGWSNTGNVVYDGPTTDSWSLF